MGRAHDPDAIIRTVLARFKDKGEPPGGRSRATLVLEPGLGPLGPALTDGNFIAVVADDLSDFEQRRELLSGRVLVTRNAPAFLDHARCSTWVSSAWTRFGGDIYVGPTLPESATATLISKAFLDFALGNERSAYLLLLHPEGRHVFRRLS